MVNLIPWKRKRKEGNGGELATRKMEPLAELREEMNSLFDRFFRRGADMDQLWSGWPQRWDLDVDDRENEIVIRAEAPGFDPEEFDIQVRGNHLVIRAEHKKESKKGDEFHCSHETIHRMIPLPDGIEEEKIDANYRRGVLEVKLPKAECTSRKRITVTAS